MAVLLFVPSYAVTCREHIDTLFEAYDQELAYLVGFPLTSEPELAEGMFKNMAAAGLMGLSALQGKATTQSDYHPNSTLTAEPQERTTPDKIHHAAVEYPMKIWDYSHSMGEQWANKTVTMNSVGPDVGQVPYSALKVGMVVDRWSHFSIEIAGHRYNHVFHRIYKIENGHIYTAGDANHEPDRGWAKPSDIVAVCIAVEGHEPDDPNFRLVIPEYNHPPGD
jgi:hypothetical protein